MGVDKKHSKRVKVVWVTWKVSNRHLLFENIRVAQRRERIINAMSKKKGKQKKWKDSEWFRDPNTKKQFGIINKQTFSTQKILR
jgi:hypothetical protein